MSEVKPEAKTKK